VSYIIKTSIICVAYIEEQLPSMSLFLSYSVENLKIVLKYILILKLTKHYYNNANKPKIEQVK